MSDDTEDLVYRLRKRAEIRRQIATRKSVQEGKPDRIADLLEEAATTIEAWKQAANDEIDLMNQHANRADAVEKALADLRSQCSASVLECIYQFPNVGEYVAQMERELAEARGLLEALRHFRPDVKVYLSETYLDAVRAFLAREKP